MIPATVKDEQYMAFAVAGAAIFSTCSRRQYMAIVLSTEGRVVGTGYNGGPSGFVHCTDGGCPRANSGAGHGSPYDNCIAIHAESNALMYSNRSERMGGTIIINGPPCYDCAKLIAGSGVKRLVYMTDPAYTEWGKVRMLLQKSGISMIEVDRARLASYGVGGQPGSDVGCGPTEEVGVAIQPRKPSTLACTCPDRTAVGSAAAFHSDDCRLPAKYR